MVFLSVWNVLMYRYTGQTDIIIGTAVAGREHADLEDQIGFYINTLALRNEIKPGESFDELFSRIKQNTLNAYSHQKYPFDKLVEELDLQRDISRNTVFDVLLGFNNNGEKIKNIQLHEKEINSISDQGKFLVKYDLEFHFTEVGEYISLQVNFNEDVYEKEVIERLTRHYKTLISALIDRPKAAANKVDFISAEEKDELIFGFNDTRVAYSKNKTLIDLFETQAKKTPDNIAIKSKERIITYKELDDLSNQFAHCIIKNYGVNVNDLVGIKLDKTYWAVISMLGILKAGAAYIPIDTNYPAPRKQHILLEAKIKLLVTDTDYLFDEDEFEGSIFAVDVEFDNGKYSKQRINQIMSSSSLAYVIYTSGSTGNPKGVMIEHGSLLNYLIWGLSKYSSGILKPLDFGLFTSLAFDLTVSSLYLPLISGGRLHIFDSTSDIYSVLKNYFHNDIGCVKLTPAHINLVKGLGIENTAIQVAIVGGDTLTNDHIKTLKRLNPNIQIYNEYGPTESTVGCTVKEILSEEEVILIGRPISNTQIYLINEEGELQPIGVSGEICIGGDGLARGYLNQEELTSKKFIENPFKAGERLYRTGDMGRWLADGNIEFIGRMDSQIKIRGYRIELGEIEHALLSKTDIQEAVVLAKENQNNEKELVAYLVSEKEQNTINLRSYLKELLPDYMLPSHYLQLAILPLTSNGKIDKKSLPDPQGLGLTNGVEYVAPRNEIEEKLVKIWQEILQRENISIKDDFFMLGGHSLKVIQTNREYQLVFGKKLPLVFFMSNPRICEHADYIMSKLNTQVENNERLIKLNIFSASNQHMIMIPPIQGEAIYFIDFSKYIQAKFNCYGINYGIEQNFESIIDISKYYAEAILTQLPDRTNILNVMGFSLGVPIAFEIVKILEGLNYNCKLFLVDRMPDRKYFYNKKMKDPLIENTNLIEKQIVNNLRIQKKYSTSGKIKSNISCLEGYKNELKFSMELWKKHTTGRFGVEKIKSSHEEIFTDKNFEHLYDFIQK